MYGWIIWGRVAMNINQTNIFGKILIFLHQRPFGFDSVYECDSTDNLCPFIRECIQIRYLIQANYRFSRVFTGNFQK